MTDQEKKHEEMHLLYDCSEAERELELLRHRASRLAEALRDVFSWVHSWGDLSLPQGKKLRSDVVQNGTRLTPFDNPAIAEALNFEGLKQLISEIDQTKTKVEQLQERKRALGLK